MPETKYKVPVKIKEFLNRHPKELKDEASVYEKRASICVTVYNNSWSMDHKTVLNVLQTLENSNVHMSVNANMLNPILVEFKHYNLAVQMEKDRNPWPPCDELATFLRLINMTGLHMWLSYSWPNDEPHDPMALEITAIKNGINPQLIYRDFELGEGGG